MRFGFVVFLLGLLTACNTPKTAVQDGPSTADYPYIQRFHEGVRLKIKGQLKEAISAFEICLNERPNDDAVAYALAECHLMLNERQQAVEYTEKAAKIDPDNIWYTQELAYMYFEQGKMSEAEKAFAKMVAKEPSNIDWLFGYAEVLKRLNKRQEAIDAYNRMEDELGPLPDLALQKYELYMQLKQETKAIAELEKARAEFPDEPAILGTLVDHYFRKNDVEKARDMLVELVKANPENGRANLALGDIYMREGNKKEGYRYFKAAFEGEGVDIDTKMNVLLTFYEQQTVIEPEVMELGEILVSKHPEDAKSWSVLGDLLLKNNKEDEALDAYREALKFDQNKFAIWNQVLLMEYRNGLFEDLYRDARACAALFPTMANVQLLYTIACVRTGRYQEAVDAADIGKELVVSDKISEAEFYAQKAEAEFRLGNLAGGIANYETAMKLDPTNHLTKNNYALMLALANHDLPKASKLIGEVTAQFPNEAPFMDTRGVILFQQGEYNNAKTLFESAHEIDPKNASYAEHLGDVWSKLGNPTKALELWKLAKSQGSVNKALDKKIQTKTYHAPVF